jgi:hypothetical protein
MSQAERDAHRREAARRAGMRFLGMVLMAAGGLIAFLCGLCTVVSMVVVTYLSSSSDVMRQAAPWLGPLVLGGVPTAVGVAMFWAGSRLYRQTRPQRGRTGRLFD